MQIFTHSIMLKWNNERRIFSMGDRDYSDICFVIIDDEDEDEVE